MVKNFKFFEDNDENEITPYDGAGWTWCNPSNLNPFVYDIVVDHHEGIRSFLDQFPRAFIVSILSITGPDGLEHNIDNTGIGWGFDILNDVITIRWVRFNENHAV